MVEIVGEAKRRIFSVVDWQRTASYIGPAIRLETSVLVARTLGKPAGPKATELKVSIDAAVFQLVMVDLTELQQAASSMSNACGAQRRYVSAW